jgi:arabinofuranosyltransferase
VSWRQVLILLVGGVLLVGWVYRTERRTLGEIGPTLDDTFIHLRFAWNLAHDQGFAFNPGEPISGATSPLWVLLLVPATLAGKDFLVQASLFLSSLCYLATALLTGLLARRIGYQKGSGLIAGGLVLLNGRLLWAGTSGMETCFFAALTLAGLMFWLRQEQRGRITWPAGGLFGLITLARPEGYLLFLIALGHHLARQLARPEQKSFRGLVRSAPWTAIAAFGVTVSPYIIFSLATIHYPLPATFVAKRAMFDLSRGPYLLWSAYYFWLDNSGAAIFLLAALVWIAFRLVRERMGFIGSSLGLVAGWAIGYFLASVKISPMHLQYCRYQIPVLPCCLLLTLGAAEEIWAWIQRTVFRTLEPFQLSGSLRDLLHWRRLQTFLAIRGTAGAMALLLLLPGLISLRPWPAEITRDAYAIRELHTAVGRWLSRATPDNAEIATVDIGAMGFYSDRKILDMWGLVTPEVLPYLQERTVNPHQSQRFVEFLWKRRPQFLVVYPPAHSGLVNDTTVFKLVFRTNKVMNFGLVTWFEVYQCFWK